jgi:ankyrin repeat protein
MLPSKIRGRWRVRRWCAVSILACSVFAIFFLFKGEDSPYDYVTSHDKQWYVFRERGVSAYTYYLVWRKSQRDYVREGEEYGLALYLIARGYPSSMIPSIISHEVSIANQKLPTTLPELVERNTSIATVLIVVAMFLGFINRVVNVESEKARAIGANLALISASGHGQMAVVRQMIDANADVNAKDADGQTALMLASQHGHLQVAEFLLANKAEFNLYDVAARGDVERAGALLAGDPDRISRKDAQDCYKGETPLHWASQHGHLNVAELLVAKKAEVNARDDKGDTPLHSAAKYGHKEVAEFLLANKADVNAKNNSGNMPLHAAAGFKDIVELLLSNKAEVSARGNDGTTPLHTAVEAGRKDVADVLLANNADVNAKDDKSATPLHFAAERGDNDIAELLVANNAEVDAKDAGGLTPADRAAIQLHYDVVKMLCQHGGHTFIRVP